jgi:hypothetical protein
MGGTVFGKGITYFIAEQVAFCQLIVGYAVRGSLRSAPRADGVPLALLSHSPDLSEPSPFLAALGVDSRWEATIRGCD